MRRILVSIAGIEIWSSAFLLAVFLVALNPVCRADHPDKEHRPNGNPEEMLSGVYINSRTLGSLRNEGGVLIEPLANVLRTLGKPLKVVKENTCESNYIWKQGDVLLEVGSGCIFQKVNGKDVMRAQGAYSVEVWGHRSDGSIGITGRGLDS